MADIDPPEGKAIAATSKQGTASSATLLQWARNEVRIIAPIITLIFLVIFFSVATTSFFSSRNVLNILEQSSLLVILATGVTMVLLVGQIDLSFANQATLVGVILTMVTAAGHTAWVAIPLCLLLGCAIGLTNGYFTAYRGVPAFMTTLAMLQITDGWAIYMTGGRPLFTVPPILDFLGNRKSGPVPNVVLMGLLVAAIAHFVLTYTRLGRYIYMVGGNPEAARVSGRCPRSRRARRCRIARPTWGTTGRRSTRSSTSSSRSSASCAPPRGRSTGPRRSATSSWSP